MPSVTRKPPTARKQQRREELGRELLAATERLMGEGMAFTELSVDRLASEAGISRATFYVYFEDKSQLLRRLAQEVFAELTTAARQWWDVADRREVADLRQAIANIIARYREHQLVLHAVIEMSAYDAEIAEVYRGIFDGIAEEVTKIIERGQTDGSIHGLPAREVATALNWMMERTCHQTLRFSPPEGDAELARAMTEIVWRSLYVQAAEAG